MDMQSLSRLLDESGRVVRYSSRFKKRVYATLYIAGKFETGRSYTELEVNDCIRAWIAFADYVLVRRDLVDFGCLTRTADCREYRRVDVLPDAEQILQ